MILREKFKQWLYTKPREQIRDIQLEVIADDYAIEFAEWCNTLINRVGLLKYKSEYINKSTKELLEIFKKEKGL
jgi:hypothetical protein